jgi:hypothetical protein
MAARNRVQEVRAIDRIVRHPAWETSARRRDQIGAPLAQEENE